MLPGKHLALAMGIKSLTGSKSAVTLVNKFGNCASDETIRRLDMELEQAADYDESCTPKDVLREPYLCTGTAWDNFDINMETLSGADTVHHTYGICYQNSLDNTNRVSEPSAHSATIKKCKKRGFEKVSSQEQEEIAPYTKKPKLSSFAFSLTSFEEQSRFAEAVELDLLWTMAKNLLVSAQVPMWIGFNSQRFTDRNPKQIVHYMNHIRYPPTRNDVVKEMMVRSQAVSKECEQQYMVVTYDLAVAKVARKIQSEESPLFDDMFIMFGSFHIELSFFSSLGKMIEGSGGPYVLSGSGILAEGSLNMFLKGKMYNRCRRSHTMLATCLHGLHLRRFIQDVSIKDDTLAALNEWVAKEEQDVPLQLKEVATAYHQYCDETSSGVRGKTAQYWMTYCTLVAHYLVLNCAMRSNNVQLFVSALFQISSLFFSTNHPNYARWMSRYALDLLNIDEAYPGLSEVLEDGAFSVRRGNQYFSRVGVDMALEQTINASTKNRLRGVVAFANTDSAVRRWLKTSSTRGQLLNKLLENTGHRVYIGEIHKDLRSSRMCQDDKDLAALTKSIENALNPFDENLAHDALFNLKAGKEASPETTECLLSLITRGREARDIFVKECIEEAARFEKPIKRMKILNFATASFKEDNGSKAAAKVVEARGTRDLFGRLLYLASKSQIDLEAVFSYPLTPTPQSLSHLDGSIRKTEKAVLMKELEEKVTSQPPEKVSNVMIDGMFLLHTLPTQLPSTLREVAQSILTKAMRMAVERVDLVFDTYQSPSIKDIERQARGESSARRFVFGPIQKTPKDFRNLLRSGEFKAGFTKFLADDFKDESHAPLISGKELYCAVDNKCTKYSSDGEFVFSEDVQELAGNHEEADTRIAFHAKHSSQLGTDNIVVRANDTDVLVILLANNESFSSSHLWLEVGVSANNSRRYIDVSKLSQQLGNSVHALPGLHAFTGCDYITSFCRLGKKKPFKVAMKDQQCIDAFAALGRLPMPESAEEKIEEFTCRIYGHKGLKDINKARFLTFCHKHKPAKTSSPFEGIKSIDPTSFAPCRKVLKQQIQQSNHSGPRKLSFGNKSLKQ